MKKLKIIKSITNRSVPSLEMYLSEISKEKLITSDEEVALAKRIKEGDDAALDKLVRANLRFVVSVAKQYQNKGLSLQDLINEGNMGLIKAAGYFDEKRGFKFISYAVWWIRQGILHALAEQSRLVRLPLNQLASLSKVNKVSEQLEQKLGRKPSVKEIAKDLEMSEKKVAAVMQFSFHHISMESPISKTDNLKFVDVYINENSPKADAAIIKNSLAEEIQRVLSSLTDREKQIINLYFGIGMSNGLTLEEIGVRFNITRERVRQIKEKSINRLKHTSRSQYLRSFLE